MYIREVSKWYVSPGLVYNTCIPVLFKFRLDADQKINCCFAYDLRTDSSIKAPESHPCFGQMQEIEVVAERKSDEVVLVHIKGMNDRFDRWMEAVFAIRQISELWEGKLILFGYGGWYKDAGYMNQWARFNVVGFRNLEFKYPILSYDYLSVSEDGKRQVQKQTVTVDFNDSPPMIYDVR